LGGLTTSLLLFMLLLPFHYKRGGEGNKVKCLGGSKEGRREGERRNFGWGDSPSHCCCYSGSTRKEGGKGRGRKKEGELNYRGKRPGPERGESSEAKKTKPDVC